MAAGAIGAGYALSRPAAEHGAHVLDEDVKDTAHLAGRVVDHAGAAVVEHERGGGAVAELLDQVGWELTSRPCARFVEWPGARGRVVVPTVLPRLDVDRALREVVLPLHLNWSSPGRGFDLRNRRQRAWVYEVVLREGAADDVVAYIDGVLLVDLWDELVLPRDVRAAWAPLVATALGDGAA